MKITQDLLDRLHDWIEACVQRAPDENLPRLPLHDIAKYANAVGVPVHARPRRQAGGLEPVQADDAVDRMMECYETMGSIPLTSRKQVKDYFSSRNSDEFGPLWKMLTSCCTAGPSLVRNILDFTIDCDLMGTLHVPSPRGARPPVGTDPLPESFLKWFWSFVITIYRGQDGFDKRLIEEDLKEVLRRERKRFQDKTRVKE